MNKVRAGIYILFLICFSGLSCGEKESSATNNITEEVSKDKGEGKKQEQEQGQGQGQEQNQEDKDSDKDLSDDNKPDEDLENKPEQKRVTLTRILTAPIGAEITGLFLNSDGNLFANIQHPADTNFAKDKNGKRYNKGTVGVITGVDFNNLPMSIKPVEIPVNTTDIQLVKTAIGEYQILGQHEDSTEDGFKLGMILTADRSKYFKSSNKPDFNAAVPDGDGGFYLYTNWEDRPGSMSRMHLSDLGANGYQSVKLEGLVDFKDVNGTWVNCFGTMSPWGTPLTSEELYFNSTQKWFKDKDEPKLMNTYLDFPSDGSGQWSNPYDYGYIVEIGVNSTAISKRLSDVQVNKLELLGRLSHENSVVMPDLRTVFLSDDGTGTVLFKFVADKEMDLSSGTLYAAKAIQTPGEKDPAKASFKIQWIKLAHAKEADVEKMIREYDGSYKEAKYIKDSQIRAWAESKLSRDLNGDGKISTPSFNDDRPAFLESRKAAERLGATAEFRKMEGININFGLASSWWNKGKTDGKQAYMYVAMSNFNETMSDNEGDVRLDGKYGTCGIVYRMKLIKNQDGLVDIDELVPAIVGGPFNFSQRNYICDANNISEPDNIVVLNDGRVIIGEDSGNHLNNMIWLFDDPATR